MPTKHEQDLIALKDMLLTMASHAEAAVTRAVKAVVERDDELAKTVKEDDTALDQFEVDVDETAITLLSQAPLASDLRLITVAMKISHDLERVGDEATTIARRAIELSKEGPVATRIDLPAMSAMAMEMLREALDAFVSRDSAEARAVIPRDKEIDRRNKEAHRMLLEHMTRSPETINHCLNLMVVCKALERIADHATNIAEEVVYLYEGRDIRHIQHLEHDRTG